jgi:hypothetical protein
MKKLTGGFPSSFARIGVVAMILWIGVVAPGCGVTGELMRTVECEVRTVKRELSPPNVVTSIRQFVRDVGMYSDERANWRTRTLIENNHYSLRTRPGIRFGQEGYREGVRAGQNRYYGNKYD